ncbi:MAG: hypothetical protein KAU95_04090 [Candidatus Aenigmarchaeota archaeon]|nr:hypothetical protein [Candidatus Aenigmarchaeota archaeon]
MDALEEKHNERMIFINATDFMVNLDETIENILVEGGQKYISMNVPAEVTFDGEKIEMKIKQKGSVIASGGWVLLGKDSDVQGKAEELSTGGYDITIQLKYNESILTGNPFNFKNTGIIKIERIGEKVRVDIYE